MENIQLTAQNRALVAYQQHLEKELLIARARLEYEALAYDRVKKTLADAMKWVHASPVENQNREVMIKKADLILNPIIIPEDEMPRFEPLEEPKTPPSSGVYWAYITPDGGFLPATVRLKPGDSESALKNLGVHRRGIDPEACQRVRVRLQWMSEEPLTH